MKKEVFSFLITLLLALSSYSVEIEEDKIYKVKADFPHIADLHYITDIKEEKKDLVLKRKARIKIVKIEDKKIDGVDDKLYYFQPEKNYTDSIKKSKIYFFRKSKNPELYLEAWQSLVHGTLVVPFKVRTKDGRLMGDATIGYYVGTERNIYFPDIEITPLISFGLSTITVPQDESDIDTKTGITAATGLVLTHAGNFQIGIIGGIDHLGGNNGDNWKYEDDFWMSFMVGYNFAK